MSTRSARWSTVAAMRGSLGCLVAASLSACGASPNFAGLKPGPRTAHFEERIIGGHLANGMRVALVPDARTNLVTVTVRYEVGGADDPPGLAGLAHYVEHVLWEAPFRSGDGAALRAVALNGNATTRLDRTYFFDTALETDLDRELEIAARRLELKCADLDDAALARERDVVVEEVKQRTPSAFDIDRIHAAVWGEMHPYAHRAGGAQFATIAKPALCEFIEQHYGPAAATLVITGHVPDDAIAKIRARFAGIPARPLAPRDPGPPPTIGLETRVTIPGLEHPTALVVFPVPGEGAEEEIDAAVSYLNGKFWWFDDYAGLTFVFGEERSRAIVALAEVEDAGDLPRLVDRMRKRLDHPRIDDFEVRRQRERLAFFDDFDDLLSTGIKIADRLARRQQVSRLQPLRDLDALKEPDVSRWLDVSQARVVLLVPEPKGERTHHVKELATELHHLDIVRSQPVETPAENALPVIPRSHELADYTLPNGLRVWLAPDSSAIALDARLVIAADAADGDRVAHQAATLLRAETVNVGGTDAVDAIKWYGTIRASVIPHVDTHATTFRVTGFYLFGDWHVWHLAWVVLHGRYPTSHERWAHDRNKPTKRDRDREPPSAFSVALHRLEGRGEDPPDHTWADNGDMQAFRARAYRPDRSTLIVTGRFDVAAMRKEIETLFGAWPVPAAPPPAAASAPRPRAPSYVAIPHDDASQVEMVLAFASPAELARSEYAARAVLNELLSDRLRRIREGLGVTYGVHSAVGRTAILVGGKIEPAFVAEASRALLDELAHIRDGDSSLEGDFARARKHVLARALADPIGASHRGAQLEGIAIDHVPLDQPERDIEAIRSLDLAAVRRVAVRDLRPDRMIVVVRGVPQLLDATLAAFGAPRDKI